MPTIVIQPDITTGKDAYINQQNGSINFGSEALLRIGGTAGYSHRALMQFNLQGIKPSTIIKAELSLYEIQYSTLFSSITYAIPIFQPWDESVVTFNTAPATDPDTTHRSQFYITGDVNHSGMFNVYDVTTAIKNDVGYGFMLKTHDDNTLYYVDYASSDNTLVANRPKLTITYNESPIAPTLTIPSGGENWNRLHTAMWNESTDPEGDILSYQIDLSTNNGSTWKTIANGVTGASLSYDFINEIETSQALIRIRAYDGNSYGDWDISNGVFTIQHNVAPSFPTNLSPKGTPADRSKMIRLTWQHNDSPNDIQSKADIRWRHQGDLLWSNITSEGTNQEYFIPPNTFPNGQTEWQVRTYDSSGVVSPWSNITVFTVADAANVPTIIQPSESVSVARPVVEWSSVSQSSYQLVVENSLGIAVWDTDEITSPVKARTIAVDLLNGGTYKVKVRVKDGSGLFSSFAERTFTVSYTPPAKPIVTAFGADGFIAVSIETRTPTGTQPTVGTHEIYKRINDEWIRVAFGVGSSFNDYYVKSGISYEYYVKAIGANGTTSNSDVASQSTTFRGSWIHAVQDADATLQYFRYNGTGYETDYEPDSAVMKFAGRTRPVVHYGAYEEYSLSVKIQSVEGMGDMGILQRFVRNRETVCYRDADGNLIVGQILALRVAKDYRVSSAVITIIETDYSEEV